MQHKQNRTHLTNTQITEYKENKTKTNKPENDTYEKWKHIMSLQHIHNQIRNNRKENSTS